MDLAHHAHRAPVVIREPHIRTVFEQRVAELLAEKYSRRKNAPVDEVVVTRCNDWMMGDYMDDPDLDQLQA